MGQKINPLGFRIGVVEPWRSRWYAKKKDFSRFLLQDHKIRQYVHKEFKAAGVPKVEIERTGEAVNVIVHTARPGVLVGRKGVRVDQLKTDLQKICGMTCHLTVKEIKRPELESTLVAEMVAESLEKRMAFRRAMKKALQTAIQAGAKGCKVEINGRLGGGEMAREAKEREGQVPLSTLRANIDYGTANANTTAGVIGVKVWIYKGDLEPGEKIDAKTGVGTRSVERGRSPVTGRSRPGREPRGGQQRSGQGRD